MVVFALLEKSIKRLEKNDRKHKTLYMYSNANSLFDHNMSAHWSEWASLWELISEHTKQLFTMKLCSYSEAT